MRKKRVWRYYCDHCKKGGCSGGSIAKHEKGCTRNPERECGICRVVGLEQKPTDALLAALEEGGVEAVSVLAESCPACIMAAIHALRKKEPLQVPRGDDYDSNFIEFDYATAAKAFWASERAQASMDASWL